MRHFGGGGVGAQHHLLFLLFHFLQRAGRGGESAAAFATGTGARPSRSSAGVISVSLKLLRRIGDDPFGEGEIGLIQVVDAPVREIAEDIGRGAQLLTRGSVIVHVSGAGFVGWRVFIRFPVDEFAAPSGLQWYENGFRVDVRAFSGAIRSEATLEGPLGIDSVCVFL